MVGCGASRWALSRSSTGCGTIDGGSKPLFLGINDPFISVLVLALLLA